MLSAGDRNRIVSVRRGLKILSVGLWFAGLLLGSAAGHGVAAEAGPDPASALQRAVSAAESRLQAGDTAAAEAHYREALFQGWLLTATLESLESRSEEAFHALRSAAAFVPDDSQSQRLLAKALAAAGQIDQAVQALEKAWATSPDDPELTFVVATDYLWLKRVEAAERLFAHLVKQRPIALTYALIGHAYRDAGEYGRARVALQAALDQDPSARRAHYYLGTVVLADPGSGPGRLEMAIAEFQEELKLAPEDPLAWDQLGVALLEAGRQGEALRAIEKALALDARALYAYHLGRCQLALQQPAEAAASSRRALELARERGASESELERIHYQLGLALRKVGAQEEAATHLAEAKRIAARWTDVPRDAKALAPSEAAAPLFEDSPLWKLPPAQRLDLKRRVMSALALVYLNLGVIRVQGERFAEAVELLEKAAAIDPDFPQLQASLGVAYFNARMFDKAIGPLSRVLAASPGDASLKRMVAMAWLNTGAYPKAAELLKDDPERARDASVQFAYGLALAHHGREPEAEAIFMGLIAEHGESAELNEALRQLKARR